MADESDTTTCACCDSAEWMEQDDAASRRCRLWQFVAAGTGTLLLAAAIAAGGAWLLTPACEADDPADCRVLVEQ